MRSARQGAVALACLALLAWPVIANASSEAGTAKAQMVSIVFTGNGGGRYLDHTRWLREDTRLCYASRLADETLAVRWQIVWTATLERTSHGYALVRPTMTAPAITGSVDGTSVRDSCDSADEEPGWSGTTTCQNSASRLRPSAGPLGTARGRAAACIPAAPRPGLREPGKPVRARHPQRPAGRRRRGDPPRDADQGHGRLLG